MSLDLPFPKLDQALIERLVPLAEELDDLASSGADCSLKVKHFNALAGTDIRDTIAFHFSGACSSRAFVRDALAATHVREYVGLTDDVLLGIIRALQQGDRAEDASFWIRVLELNLPGAPLSNLLFYPDQVPGHAHANLPDDPSPADVLRAARSLLAAQPIQLGADQTRDPQPPR